MNSAHALPVFLIESRKARGLHKNSRSILSSLHHKNRSRAGMAIVLHVTYFQVAHFIDGHKGSKEIEPHRTPKLNKKLRRNQMAADDYFSRRNYRKDLIRFYKALKF